MSASGRDVLLEHMSEDDLTETVRIWARQGGWCGIHVRRSRDLHTNFAALQGVHAGQRRSLANHDDQEGFPDWLFVRPNDPVLFVELKSSKGRLSGAQQRWRVVLEQLPGSRYMLIDPKNAEELRDILLSAPGSQAR